jgi:hypothetical protein
MGGKSQIVNVYQMGVAFATGSTGTNEKRTTAPRPGCHGCLSTHLITGVNDGIRFFSWQQRRPIARLDKFFNAIDPAPWVD